MIGPADGKKYRNFAQGLTFDMMIGHANGQLQKMTDRYLLIRDDAQPLELNVVDNYQAGEIRSTKNLSGGESFIVSLSLALGLRLTNTALKPLDFVKSFKDLLSEQEFSTRFSNVGQLEMDQLIGNAVSGNKPTVFYYGEPNPLVHELDILRIDLGVFDATAYTCFGQSKCGDPQPSNFPIGIILKKA